MVKKKIVNNALIAILSVCILVTCAYAILSVVLDKPFQGNVWTIGVEVYAEPECINIVNNVDFGGIYPDDSNSFTYYVKNTRNTDVTLTVVYTDILPVEVLTVLDFSATYDTGVLAAGEVTPLQLTVTHNGGDDTGLNDYSGIVRVTATEYIIVP